MTLILTIMQTYRLLSLLQLETGYFFTRMHLCIFIKFIFLHSRLLAEFFFAAATACFTSKCKKVCNTGRRHAYMLFSLNQASLWRFEKFRIVDGVLCALPQAAALGCFVESLGCAHIEGVDNYQTRSDSSDTKTALTSSLLVASKGRSPFPAHSAHPEHFSSLLRGRDVLFHNKTWNWLLSALVNWT